MDRPSRSVLKFSKDADALQRAIDPYRDTDYNFDVDEFITGDGNLALTDGEGNWGLFSLTSDGVYTGHYFFEVRGRAAITLGREMLDYFFRETGEKALRGVTPLTNLKARWMSRQLGFEGHGVVKLDDEYCELFIMTRNINE